MQVLILEMSSLGTFLHGMHQLYGMMRVNSAGSTTVIVISLIYMGVGNIILNTLLSTGFWNIPEGLHPSWLSKSTKLPKKL